MTKRINELILQEIKLENLKYDSLKNLNFKLSEIIDELVLKILKSNGGDARKIKKWIVQQLEVLYDEFHVQSKAEIEEQKELIAKDDETSLTPIIIAGFLFSELISNQKNSNLRKMFEKVNNKDVDFKDFVKKNQEQLKTILRTSSRALREEVRAKQGSPIGWQSVAVLDNKTSAICVSLHQEFYKATKFTYESIPNKPPRHLGCRSMLVAIYDKKEMVKDFNFKEFITEFGLELLGETKYNMFLSGKYPINSFLDIKDGRWYTIKEIIGGK